MEKKREKNKKRRRTGIQRSRRRSTNESIKATNTKKTHKSNGGSRNKQIRPKKKREITNEKAE